MTFTVTETEGTAASSSVRPAGTPYKSTSSINWFGPDQNLATTVVSALGGDRQISVLGGGGTDPLRRRRHRLLPLIRG